MKPFVVGRGFESSMFARELKSGRPEATLGETLGSRMSRQDCAIAISTCPSVLWIISGESKNNKEAGVLSLVFVFSSVVDRFVVAMGVCVCVPGFKTLFFAFLVILPEPMVMGILKTPLVLLVIVIFFCPAPLELAAASSPLDSPAVSVPGGDGEKRRETARNCEKLRETA